MTDTESGDATRGKFVIAGQEYPFPELGEGFSMDEAMVFYDYTGFAIEELFSDDEEMEEDETAELEHKRRSPKVFAALMHLAYARAHPKAAESNIRRIIKATDFVTAIANFASEEDEEGPPAEAQKSEQPTSFSDENAPLSLASSGNGSTTSSDPPDGSLAPTGISESGTSAESALTESAL